MIIVKIDGLIDGEFDHEGQLVDYFKEKGVDHLEFSDDYDDAGDVSIKDGIAHLKRINSDLIFNPEFGDEINGVTISIEIA